MLDGLIVVVDYKLGISSRIHFESSFVANAEEDEDIDPIAPKKKTAGRREEERKEGQVKSRRGENAGQGKEAKRWAAVNLSFISISLKFCKSVGCCDQEGSQRHHY